jgi:hypothetical protein
MMMEDPSQDPYSGRRGRARGPGWPPPPAQMIALAVISAAMLAIGIYNLAIGSWRGPGVMVIWGVLTGFLIVSLLVARHRAR